MILVNLVSTYGVYIDMTLKLDLFAESSSYESERQNLLSRLIDATKEV